MFYSKQLVLLFIVHPIISLVCDYENFEYSMWGEWTSCKIENGNENQQRNRTFIYDCMKNQTTNKPNVMTSGNNTSINQTTGYDFEKRTCESTFEESTENIAISLNKFLQPFVPSFFESPVITTSLTATTLFAISPPPLPLFPPQGLPQPGILSGGGGALPSVITGNLALLADVAAIVEGIEGANIVSIFSTSLENSGFLVPRTLPATAVVFTEPQTANRRKKSHLSSSHTRGKIHKTCSNSIIPLGDKKDFIHRSLSPVLDPILSLINSFQSKTGLLKAQLYDFLGLQCLIPTLIQPYEPFLLYVRCLLGLDSESSIKVPRCSSIRCTQTDNEVREISRHLDLPSDLHFTNLRVRTMADCFPKLPKIRYGTRVLTKLVDDQPCQDLRYTAICDILLEQNRVILAEQCDSERCDGPNDDPFKACFGCQPYSNNIYGYNTSYGGNYHQDYWDRQTSEYFTATKQSRRLICQNRLDRRNCRIRIDRAMELRSETYMRVLRFIQSEEYLSEDDLDIIRYYYI